MSNKPKVKALFRCGKVLDMPCNWNIDGNCGADSHLCEIIRLVR